MGNGADEAPPRCQVTPPKPKDKGGAEAPSQSDLRVYKSLHERGRRSTSTPTQPQTSTTPRRASRGPTKVDNVFRWRFTCSTSKGPRHQGAVWRFNVIYKEQGTISIIELLAHKQKPASVQTGPWTSCGRSEFAPSSCSPLLHFRDGKSAAGWPARIAPAPSKRARHVAHW